MNIYLAARFNRNIEMRAIRDALEKLGHKITSRWIDLELAEEERALRNLNWFPRQFAENVVGNIEDLRDSDMVISFTEGGGGRGGRHTEFGMAVMSGKRLILIGPREHVFHCLPEVIQFESFSHFLQSGIV